MGERRIKYLPVDELAERFILPSFAREGVWFRTGGSVKTICGGLHELIMPDEIRGHRHRDKNLTESELVAAALWLAGLSREDAAGMMGNSESTFSNLVSDAKNALRKRLGEFELPLLPQVVHRVGLLQCHDQDHCAFDPSVWRRIDSDSLSPLDKETVRLYMLGFSAFDIAEIQGNSEKTIKNRISVIGSKLRMETGLEGRPQQVITAWIFAQAMLGFEYEK